MICPRCNGTGESTGNGQLDCSAPNCTAAADRARFNEAMAQLPPMTRDDVNWAAYQAGERIAEQRWKVERAELIRQLRRMWGWAIELDANCIKGLYFDDDSLEGRESKGQWRADTREVLALLQKEPKCKS